MFLQNNRPQLKLLLTLICGIVVGFSFSQLLHSSKCLLGFTVQTKTGSSEGSEEYATPEPPPPNAFMDEAAGLAWRSAHYRQDANSSLADRLFNETRVLCWVLTGPSNHAKRAVHVKNTWGSRCNKLIFMSSQEDTELGAVKLDVGEGRGNLWRKTREAMKYIYDHHLDEADWFFKADDDTYLIAENLRAFLYPFSTEEPVYFGCKFKPHVRQGYMSGGAGYVLSKEALRRFVERAYRNATICRQRSGGSEDKELGICLQNVGVAAGDSRDELKRGRFFPSGPHGHIIPKEKSHWYWRYIFYATEDGLNCCSDHAITFHYIQPPYFYVLDYLIYHLRPFGVLHANDELPAKLNTTALVEKWLAERSDNTLD